MTTITIPKKSITDDLIIIPRKELARLLTFAQKDDSSNGKNLKTVALEAKARKNLVGPFLNTRDLFKSLNI